MESVLCILERAEHPVRVNLQLASVALDELRERSLVTANRGADGLLFHCVCRRGPLLSARQVGTRSYGRP